MLDSDCAMMLYVVEQWKLQYTDQNLKYQETNFNIMKTFKLLNIVELGTI